MVFGIDVAFWSIIFPYSGSCPAPLRGSNCTMKVVAFSLGGNRPTSLIFELHFVAERDSDVMRLKVQGQIGPLKPENFPGFKNDACSNMGVECPLVAGKQYTAKSQLTMSPTFPPTQAKAIFKGVDAAGELFCFSVPVELKQ
uniref:Putative ml domain-containing protein n=2 Tax=Ixodes ricinus TaxID=34613 RepID=V5H0G4_IXORI